MIAVSAPSDSHHLLYSCIAALVAFIIYVATLTLARKRESLHERVERMVTKQGQDASSDEEVGSIVLEPLTVDKEPSELGKRCEIFLTILGFDVNAFRKRSQLRFYRSGVQSPDAPAFYLFFKYIGSIFFFIMGIVSIFTIHPDSSPMTHYGITLLCVVLGVNGADMYLNNKRAKREKLLENGFPDMLDLLLVCVESGLALDGALMRVCKEIGHAHADIAQEMNRLRLELTLLNDRVQAFINLAERTDMICFRTLVSSLTQAERFGGSVADTLKVLSEDYRNQRVMRAEVAAGRLPVLMTVPMMVFLLPALFLIILGPAIIGVMDVMTAGTASSFR